MTPSCSHVGFADESRHNLFQFRGVGFLTVEREAGLDLHNWLVGLLDFYGVRSFEYKALSDGRRSVGFREVVDRVVDLAADGRLRIDVLTWDIEDRRHKVVGRNDRENLGRMYYHLIGTTLAKRWADGGRWRLFLHTSALRSASEFGFIVESGKSRREADPVLISLADQDWIAESSRFRLIGIEEVTSEEQPLVQIADLFTGLATLSRLCIHDYRQYVASDSGQLSFMPGEPDIGKNQARRFAVIRHLVTECKRRKMGVGLTSNLGLRTPDPTNPINFWWYEPQSDLDVAPTRDAS